MNSVKTLDQLVENESTCSTPNLKQQYYSYDTEGLHEAVTTFEAIKLSVLIFAKAEYLTLGQKICTVNTDQTSSEQFYLNYWHLGLVRYPIPSSLDIGKIR
jgi:hypothetical protein